MTTEQLAEPQTTPQGKKIWKSWKWIGLAVYATALLFNRWLPWPVILIAYLYGIVVIANLIFLLSRYLKNRLFWRVRNRLIGAFVFVGVIPLVLLAGVVFLTAYVLLGQLGGRYLEESLQHVRSQLTSINSELGGQLTAENNQAEFPRRASATLQSHAAQFPRLAARLLRQEADGSLKVVGVLDPGGLEKNTPEYPGSAWLGGNPPYDGLVRQGLEAVLMVSLHPVRNLDRHYLVISAPLDGFIEERLQREKSIYFALIGLGRTNVVIRNTGVEINVDETSPDVSQKDQQSVRAMESRRRGDPRQMITWGLALSGKEYATGKDERVGMCALSVPVETIYQFGLGASDTRGKVFLTIIYVLGGMFVFAELVSLVIGITISRRITRSVHDMYQGTLALQRGDLQHRIPVRRQDQLGMLAHSFNQMSTAITRLLEEVSEKKRLEQELEIAREVQATLFPKQLPHPRGMALFGGCEPARVVSGDYYDFILEDEARLDIVVADISGKGISAALLMANLQAAMRNQLLSLKPGHDIGRNLAAIMAHLNQQIYLNSPAEKYATLFLSRYDAETRRLWYCNAGHLPPILLTDQGTQMLEPTGMVVGLLPDASYEARSVDLTPGALLAIFTDGVTEAVNKDDVEFGEERLLEFLKQARTRTPEDIYRLVVGRIRDWQGDLPQHDDITLIVAKAG
jgi:phosphoserine phosphatase RsbU/P